MEYQRADIMRCIFNVRYPSRTIPNKRTFFDYVLYFKRFAVEGTANNQHVTLLRRDRPLNIHIVGELNANWKGFAVKRNTYAAAFTEIKRRRPAYGSIRNFKRFTVRSIEIVMRSVAAAGYYFTYVVRRVFYGFFITRFARFIRRFTAFRYPNFAIPGQFAVYDYVVISTACAAKNTAYFQYVAYVCFCSQI